jgi:hypothetical protein
MHDAKLEGVGLALRLLECIEDGEVRQPRRDDAALPVAVVVEPVRGRKIGVLGKGGELREGPALERVHG